MRRPDPLIVATLLGLVLAGLVATLHPHEPYDPDDPMRQVGRNVAVRLEVRASEHGDTWSRGVAVPVTPRASASRESTGTTADAASDLRGGRLDGGVAWVWFRPPVRPLPGDHIVGTARVAAQGAQVELVLSEDGAGTVPGPHPVPVRWDALIDHPEAFEGRLLLLQATLAHDHLRSPDGARQCLVDGDMEDAPRAVWALRLVRDPVRPGWRCVLEGAL